MKAVVQIVQNASVEVADEVVGSIGRGIMILLGVMEDDLESDMDLIIEKLVKMRTFSDLGKSFELSIDEIDGEILVVSQFTLAGKMRKGRRPEFTGAMNPNDAELMYNKFVDKLRDKGLKVETGKFGAYMKVNLLNDGPITYVFDSKDL
jgi:D-tyrosyl-tRNA(Tyr) deacylase